MINYCYALFDEFVNFIGGRTGLVHWILFVGALLACAWMGKDERKRLFWPSVLVLIFFFNPVFYAKVGTRFLTGVYWRLLWMLPISFVLAYAVVQLVCRVPKRLWRAGVLLAACICIAVTGEREFSRETYTEKENAYELPQAAIEVADVVHGGLREWKETIIVPNELLCYMRQYSCSVGLLYGRNFGGFITEIEPDEAAVYAEMSKEEPDLDVVTGTAKERGCRYIVFNMAFHKIPEDLTEYGYEKITVVSEDYAVYRRIDE